MRGELEVATDRFANTDAADGPVLREATEPALLVLRGVSKTWRDGAGTVLDSIDLDIRPGSLVSLVGANGVGKTTFLRVVAGLITADSGTVSLAGLTARSARREYQRRVGFLQAGQSGLYARYSVREHLAFWARIAFVPRSHRRDAVEQSMHSFGLESLGARRADRLSTGQRQRLRLALTFLHDPPLVLLDEPNTSLDSDGVELLHAAVSKAVLRGSATVWCAPTADDVSVPADAAFALADGKVWPA
jgi:ABC-2 type transport system ATP-binding protein